MYSDKVMEHFKNPKNQGKMEDADGVGKVGNPTCGDVMWIYIKVKDNKIADIKFQTFGCVAAIATSSIITELAKGRTLESALNITNKDVSEAVDGLPPIKIHCSVLAAEGLNEAVYDYYKKNNIPIPEKVQQKHEKILKELEEIKEKYGDFAKLEESISEE